MTMLLNTSNVIDIYNTANKYEIIVSDPPWKQSKGGLRKARPNQSRELDYDTMTLEDIKELHRHVFDNLAEETHTVFMWTIDKFLPETEQMMKELGYKMHARMVWDKTNGVAPAFTVRYSHEYLLWFYKPKMTKINPDMRGKFRTCFSEPATKHSKKPLVSYEMIEALYPTQSKLELFARYPRDGWDGFGNELNQ